MNRSFANPISKIRKKEAAQLPSAHLCRHMQQHQAVALRDPPKRPAKLPQRARIFSGGAPGVDSLFSNTWYAGCFGRLFAIVEQLIHRDFESSCEFFKRLNRWYGVAVFHARDVAALQSCACFDIALREFLGDPECPEAFADDHAGIISNNVERCKCI